MNRVDRLFAACRSEERMALGAYVVAGYPDYDSSLEALLGVVDAGADMIELGIPHSDPIADGRVLQGATQQALRGGMTPGRALHIAEEARTKVEVPILMMTYFNPVLQYGQQAFCNDCRRLDLDGMLVPDLPVEESGELLSSVKKEDLRLVYFLSVNSPANRVDLVAKVANGFVYLFSALGVTGERRTMEERVSRSIRFVKARVDKPVCVGFGISSPEQVAALKGFGADGVIVGSGIVRRLNEGIDSACDFVSSLRRAC